MVLQVMEQALEQVVLQVRLDKATPVVRDQMELRAGEEAVVALMVLALMVLAQLFLVPVVLERPIQ